MSDEPTTAREQDPAIFRLQGAVNDVERALAGYDHNAQLIGKYLGALFPDATGYSALGYATLARDEITRLRDALGPPKPSPPPKREVPADLAREIRKLHEARDRAVGAVMLLVYDGVISEGRARELLGLSIHEQRAETKRMLGRP